MEGTSDNLLNNIQGILPFFGEYGNTQNDKITFDELASSINKSINPCHDFYDYVCSGWINNHKIPDYELAYTRFSDINYKVRQQLIDIMQDSSNINNGIGQMMTTFYNKCLDPNEKNRYGTSYVMYKLQEIKSRKFQYLTDFMIYVFPKTTFFSISAISDPFNSSINSISISRTFPTLHFSYFINEENNNLLTEYRNYLTKVLELLVESDRFRTIFKEGPNEIKRRVDSYLMLQKELAIISNLTLDDNHLDDFSKIIDKVTLNELQSTLPSVNWQRFFENILPQDVLSKMDISNIPIYIYQKNALQMVDKFLHKISRNTMNDLLDWVIIFSYHYTLDKRFDELDLQFDSVYLGIKKKEPEMLRCLQSSLDIFSDYVDLLYVKKYFNENTKIEVEKLVKNILSVVTETLITSDWMDEETKKNALKKVEKMIINVGYSNVIFNTTKLEENFSTLYFNNENMLPDIYDRVKKWKSLLNFKQLTEINQRNSNLVPSYITDAYYMPSENLIGILAGVLQSGIYDSKFPIPLNYGGIGAIVGHEITHGFDDTGSQYDEVGNFKNWWDKSSKEKFLEKKNCFIKMYNDVYIEELGEHLDGFNTQGENVADDGGIRIAFKTMKKVLQSENYQNKKTIEGLEEYNDDQLFFLNYAFNWCSVETKESLRYRWKEDVHTIPKYRVNVLLRNNEDFIKAFNCRKPDYMVGDKVCRIF
ncbi:Endothelin-converting enzyme-like 1 [Strongyloides ratti]|uniref:Endothelin-converting enzyme-like 1 n=1 Tax=Strongyloides ratti TaxID=34506 RepID=A0A090L7V8_STRRB|nr:Endothelin-converting enzyme-like 1 [Strongyloides ratti]CEF65822.1 Endothelin-converting enzyme-like 1 [Strongyloides ratti]